MVVIKQSKPYVPNHWICGRNTLWGSPPPYVESRSWSIWNNTRGTSTTYAMAQYVPFLAWWNKNKQISLCILVRHFSKLLQKLSNTHSTLYSPIVVHQQDRENYNNKLRLAFQQIRGSHLRAVKVISWEFLKYLRKLIRIPTHHSAQRSDCCAKCDQLLRCGQTLTYS